jgi:hypothetical protein
MPSPPYPLSHKFKEKMDGRGGIKKINMHYTKKRIFSCSPSPFHFLKSGRGGWGGEGKYFK